MKLHPKTFFVAFTLAALFFTGTSFAFAAWQGTTWITNGSVVDATKIKDNFDYLYSLGGDNLGSGGTTTGTLYSKNTAGYGYVGAEGGASSSHLRFDASPAPSAGRIYVNLLNTWEYVFTSTYFGPYVTNVNDLGSSSVRWKDGWFSGSVSAASFLYSSDARLKKDVRPLAVSKKLLSVEPKRFVWRESDAPDIGFIAQDVEKVFPEFVHTNKDGIKSVDYAKLVVPLLGVVREQQKEIDALKARLDAVGI